MRKKLGNKSFPLIGGCILAIAVLLGIAILLLSGCLLKKGETSALYIYMCGSTLETNGAAATSNIKEMLETEVPDNTTVIIQTGGSKKWRDYDIASDKLSRYAIENHKLVLKQTVNNDNMGESSTLSDFLDYCDKEYPAERKSVILWDHGSGSIGGVCFDQNYGMDSLTVGELQEAFAKGRRHYDMIGFDACLMATLDTSVVMSEFADYMLASQEIEPSGGWDYRKVIENYGTKDDIVDFGKAICDAYMKKCKKNKNDLGATLALIDLSKMENVKKNFGTLSEKMESLTKKKYGNFEILSASDKSTKFGGNGALEGYNNLLDLYQFAKNFSEKEGEDVCQSIEQAIPYKVAGESRKNASGVSLYYPFEYDKEQLQGYIDVCKEEPYKNYLENLYSDIPKKRIQFKDKGSIAKDGSFRIQLTEASKKYIKSVNFYLIEFKQSEDDMSFKPVINGLGIDNDIFKDWDKMDFHSNFRGVWLALDGYPLSYSVVESNESQIVFSAPVIVNDSLTNLRFSFIFDDQYPNGGYYQTIGLWDGMDEDGIVSKKITSLKKGDHVTILSRKIDVGDYNASLSKGKTYTIGGKGGKIQEIPLTEKNYQYVYEIKDIFGKVYYSDTAIFQMRYTKEELEKNPLPDGKYAAKITAISSDVDNKVTYGGMDED